MLARSTQMGGSNFEMTLYPQHHRLKNVVYFGGVGADSGAAAGAAGTFTVISVLVAGPVFPKPPIKNITIPITIIAPTTTPRIPVTPEPLPFELSVI